MSDISPDDLDADVDVFDADAWHAEHRSDPYRFRWSGRVWELPHPRDLPMPLLTLIDQEDNMDVAAIRDAIVSAFGPAQWEKLNQLKPIPVSVLPELFTRWMRHGGTRPGESSSSADSSPSTVEHSRPTSAASTV